MLWRIFWTAGVTVIYLFQVTDQRERRCNAVEEIRARADSMTPMFNSGDIDALVSMYADDYIIILPGFPNVVGPEALRTYFVGLVEQFRRVDVHTVESEVNILCADWGVMRCQLELVDLTGGVARSNALTTWKKIRGEWFIY